MCHTHLAQLPPAVLGAGATNADRQLLETDKVPECQHSIGIGSWVVREFDVIDEQVVFLSEQHLPELIVLQLKSFQPSNSSKRL